MKFKIFKTVLSAGLAAILLLTPASVSLSAGEGAFSGPAAGAAENAEIKGRDEVIYAVLESDGSVRTMYAVNHFALAESGSITDYGDYTSVKNLTDTAALTHDGDSVTVQADAENFYYQGNMAGADLPWTFDILYLLDGVEIAPQELAGKSGELEIQITTGRNGNVNPVFYENYLLQISVTLDTGKCSDIKAPGATVANAGKNKVAAYTVMPGAEADISLNAAVRDFTMTGIDISAMPFSMDIELPDTDGMINEFSGLSDAISAINDGVGELADGAAELKNGAEQLKNGSSGIKEGLSGLSGSSGQLIQASSQIGGALAQIASSLNGESGEINPGELTQLPQGLSQLADGLNGISGGLIELKTGFASAYAALDSAMQGIPDVKISQEQIAALYTQTDSSQHGILDRLTASYAAGQIAKGTYNQVKGAFDAVGSTADTLSASSAAISAALEDMSKKIEAALSGTDMIGQLAQLSAGLSELDKNYAAFHGGLVDYTNGVGELSSGYAGFHSGLSSFGNGIGELYNGMSGLHDGTAELSGETAKIPDTIESEIDDMLNQYTGTDFEPVSFTSPKNERADLVQFVLKCDAIEKPEETREIEVESSNETFWDRLTSLFTGKRES